MYVLTPIKRSDAQPLDETTAQEENRNSGYFMQSPMDSSVSGIDTKLERHLVCQIYFLHNKGVPDSERNVYLSLTLNVQ